jgi:DNA-binding MarR family transcriptional regulator
MADRHRQSLERRHIVIDHAAAARPRAAKPTITRGDIGFLLAKASQRWNELLAEEFQARGYPEVRPAYGSVLVPLFEEDGQRMGTLAARARLAKQTMTTMVPLIERAGLVRRRADPSDARATRVYLTERGRRLKPIAAAVVTKLERRARHRLGGRGVQVLRSALEQLADL